MGKNRIIFVPQYPTKMRYSEWWIEKFQEEFRKHFDRVITLGYDYYLNIDNVMARKELFSPVNEAINFELAQIKEYMNMQIYKDDILFLADLSFPGIFSNILYHKKPKKIYAYCHATAKNKYDYLKKVETFKFQNEISHSILFDKIFIGSEYHFRKLYWPNLVIVGLPAPPKNLIYKYPNIIKNKFLCSVARQNKQKVNKLTEKFLEEKFKIHRPMDGSMKNWHLYSKFLTESKILIISSLEDTFNYTILDAVRCECIPIAPNKLCFPEILPRDYLYSNIKDLAKKLLKVNNGELDVPKILCQNLVDNFFDNICNIMKDEPPIDKLKVSKGVTIKK